MPTRPSDRKYLRKGAPAPKREHRLVGEFLVANFPQAIHYIRLRLPYPPGASQGPLTADFPPGQGPVTWRVADAVVVQDHTLTLIEGAFVPDIDKIGQILYYSELLYHCPTLRPYRDHVVELLLLSGVQDPELGALCNHEGIAFQVFNPPWVRAYIRSLRPRARRRPRLR